VICKSWNITPENLKSGQLRGVNFDIFMGGGGSELASTKNDLEGLSPRGEKHTGGGGLTRLDVSAQGTNSIITEKKGKSSVIHILVEKKES